jgi:glycerol uptake facilitator-like aquaporin
MAADADETGRNEPPPSPACCDDEAAHFLPKSTVGASCLPFQPFEDLRRIETVRGRCLVLPTTNDKGQTECIPFVVTDRACQVAGAVADDEEQQRNDNLGLRPILAEFLGTAILVHVVVGSGIAGETYSTDIGVALSAFATFAALYGLILIFGPVSGAHFNPIVSAVDVALGLRPASILPLYAIAQTAGAILGAILANVTYDVEIALSETERSGGHLWLSEVLGTASLLLIIHGCLRTNHATSIPFAVAAWVGGGYFTFSSTIFANPAVTVGRMFSNTFAGVRIHVLSSLCPDRFSQ